MVQGEESRRAVGSVAVVVGEEGSDEFAACGSRGFGVPEHCEKEADEQERDAD